MWNVTTRAQHARKGPGLPGVLTGAEWAVLEPFLPAAASVDNALWHPFSTA